MKSPAPTPSAARFWDTVHSRAFRNIALARDNVLIGFSLSSAEWFVLDVVRNAPEKGIQVGQIAHTISVQTTYIAMLLRQLQAKKLVSVKLSSHDRRVHLVTLTDSGKQKMNAAEEALEEAFTSWTNAMTAADINAHMRVFDTLSQTMPDIES